MTCDCTFCQREPYLEGALSRVNNDMDRRFLRRLHDSLVTAEEHRDYYRAVVQGKMRGSDQIIASYRGK